jgi:hypothetical protein
VSDVFAGNTMLLRHVAGSSTWSVLATSGANRFFRGVWATPPCDDAINGPCGGFSPSPFPTPSATASSSMAPSSTASSSRTRSASASLTASTSLTATPSPTATESLPAGVSPSPTASVTPSASPSPTRAPYVFQTGNLVLWRLGNGSAIPAGSTAAHPYFFDEATLTGGATSASVVRSIALPTTGTTACTGAVSTLGEGGGSVSWDGRYLVVPCFSAPVGTASVSTTSAWPNRVIVRLGADSDVRSVRWPEVTAGNLRGAATLDGTGFWSASGGGVRYIPTDGAFNDLPPGSTFLSASVSLVTQTTTQFRGISFAADAPDAPQLLTAYSASSTFCGLYSVGAGAPTVAPAAMTSTLSCTAFSMGTFWGYWVQDVNTVWAISSTTL